jgi:hypothetical protein
MVGLFLLLTSFLSTGRTEMNVFGGYSDSLVTDSRIVAAAEFAVKEEEKALREKKDSPTTKLTLIKILSAQQQVVAGSNFLLKLIVTLNSTDKLVEAVVFQKLSEECELTSWEWK